MPILAAVVLLLGAFSIYEYGPEISSGTVGWIGAKCVKAARAEKLIDHGWCEQVSDTKCEAKGKIKIKCWGVDKETIKEKVQQKKESSNPEPEPEQLPPEPQPETTVAEPIVTSEDN